VRRARAHPLLLALLMLGAAGGWLAGVPAARASDPGTGEAVAAARGCGTCHALPGGATGTRPGPAFLSPAPPRPGAEIVRGLWNHIPEMRRHVTARALAWPVMRPEEMEALLAFLGRAPGPERSADPDRGRLLVMERGCLRCHGLGGSGGRTASDLGIRRSGGLAMLAATLWNTAPAMVDALDQGGLPFPALQPGEMADVLGFLGGAGRGTR